MILVLVFDCITYQTPIYGSKERFLMTLRSVSSPSIGLEVTTRSGHSIFARFDGTTGGYGASYAFIHTPGDAPENYNVMHSSDVYLVNPKGQWELIYDFQQLQQASKVASDVDYILNR
jgi:cytochrome oxidase Cu insertion factor (SCO1/SenC/PrrC family)